MTVKPSPTRAFKSTGARMKVQDLIDELERYKRIHGNDEVEFSINPPWGASEEVYLTEVHDGYSDSGRECEIRFKP